ncbi:MAG: FAD-dependent oxidoreductase [Gemmatimonadota bacterium]
MSDQSLWRLLETPRFGATPLPTQVDVVVIGGGITGLTAALLLKRQGKRVAVFERERIGSGETGNTSAHLTYVTDRSLRDMAKKFGENAARQVWNGGADAIDLIETHAAGSSCGFHRVPGFQCAPFFGGRDDAPSLQEDAAFAVRLGFEARFVEQGPVTGKPAIAFADQAIIQPLAYLAVLAIAIEGSGSSIHEMCEVGSVMQDPLAVVVNGETIACDDVVIATHVPMTGSTNLLSATLLQTKLYPYSPYVVDALIDESIAPGLYSDGSDPYYFLRVHDDRDGRHAIFGGEDHKTGQESDTRARFARLEEALLALMPKARIQRRWSGQVIETDDGLPFVGPTDEHQYVATGYSGNGLTFGTLAGIMIRDAITGVEHPLAKLFDPNRKASSLDALATFAAENVDLPLHFVADRLRGVADDDVECVARGEGKVLTIDGKRVACHRTSTGRLYKVSAVCTHLGCLVRWNNAESTWDCPCHGSRFTPEGLVLGGPAEAPLSPIE